MRLRLGARTLVGMSVNQPVGPNATTAEGVPSLKTAGKQQRGWPFRPGQSGNPRGRAKGVPNKASREVREIARDLVEDPDR